MAMVALLRMVTVFAWWARPRAAIRCQAPASRSPCHPHPGQAAHFHPGWDGLSGALQCRSGARHRGQLFEVPRAGTVTTAMPCSAAMCRSLSTIFPRTAWDSRTFIVLPMLRASMVRRSSM
jgi:hypothetical protein